MNTTDIQNILDKSLEFVERVNRPDIDAKNYFCSVRSDHAAKFKRFLIKEYKKLYNYKTFSKWEEAEKWLRGFEEGPGFVTRKNDKFIVFVKKDKK